MHTHTHTCETQQYKTGIYKGKLKVWSSFKAGSQLLQQLTSNTTAERHFVRDSIQIGNQVHVLCVNKINLAIGTFHNLPIGMNNL